MNDIKHKMLVWNIKWLEEQQNQQVFFLILNLKFLRSFCCTYKQNRELSADTQNNLMKRWHCTGYPSEKTQQFIITYVVVYTKSFPGRFWFTPLKPVESTVYCKYLAIDLNKILLVPKVTQYNFTTFSPLKELTTIFVKFMYNKAFFFYLNGTKMQIPIYLR